MIFESIFSPHVSKDSNCVQIASIAFYAIIFPILSIAIVIGTVVFFPIWMVANYKEVFK